MPLRYQSDPPHTDSNLNLRYSYVGGGVTWVDFDSDGDLDAYVVHFDHPKQFGSHVVKPIFNAISARLHALLPSATSRLADALEHERVRERLYTGTMASGVISDDLVVNNVGVSSEYQSPPHFDVADVGWTAAFAGA